jgi:hypothetical protein
VPRAALQHGGTTRKSSVHPSIPWTAWKVPGIGFYRLAHLNASGLRKRKANFRVITEWTPHPVDKARKEVNQRRRYFNMSKTGLSPRWATTPRRYLYSTRSASYGFNRITPSYVAPVMIPRFVPEMVTIFLSPVVFT